MLFVVQYMLKAALILTIRSTLLGQAAAGFCTEQQADAAGRPSAGCLDAV